MENTTDMKHFKMLFAGVLLLLALPLWRSLDLLIWLWKSETLYATAFFFWGFLFLVFPAWILKPRPWAGIMLGFTILGTIFSYNLGPLSSMASDNASHTHCGRTTYTGMFYPALAFFTQAPADDLEARNQLCWIKKMTQKVPKFSNQQERDDYIRLIQNKLLNPENKYRVALPLIALLYGVIFAHEEDAFPNPENAKLFVDSLKFWIDQYTVEISGREYSWWDFPYGPYIQFEYGFLERNWEKIINSLVVEQL